MCFKAIWFDADSYLLQLWRDIALNDLRAEMAWLRFVVGSGALVGEDRSEKCPKFPELDWISSHIGKKLNNRERLFMRLFSVVVPVS